MIGLPHGWYTVDGTYTRVPADKLPPLTGLDGSFRWLTPPDPRIAEPERMRLEGAALIADQLHHVAHEATKVGLAIPAELVTFLSTPGLPSRIPSATACYFDLGTRLVEIPGHSGPERLLRFINDQQISVVWYVLLAPDGSHEVVAGTPTWKDSDEELAQQEEEEDMSLDDAMEPRDLMVCGSSVEEFLKRFWIENTLWFAASQGYPAIEGELAAYQAARAS